MSSPFSAMRRHQKVFLAIFGVICMIVFVVGDPLGSLTRIWKSGESEQKIVEWKNGSLTDRELASLRQRHQITYRFLFDIAQQTKDKKGNPVSAEVSLAVVDKAVLALSPDPSAPMISQREHAPAPSASKSNANWKTTALSAQRLSS